MIKYSNLMKIKVIYKKSIQLLKNKLIMKKCNIIKWKNCILENKQVFLHYN